jgi:hypothetical protein
LIKKVFKNQTGSYDLQFILRLAKAANVKFPGLGKKNANGAENS